MADIAAGDVSAVIISKHYLPQVGSSTPGGGAGRKKIQVLARVSVDPGTSDAYPTGGVLLTNLFTAAAAADTGIDPGFPVHGTCSLARNKTTPAIACVADFVDSAATAAGKLLKLHKVPADGGTNPTLYVEYTNTDITAANELCASDTDFTVDLTLTGWERA